MTGASLTKRKLFNNETNTHFNHWTNINFSGPSSLLQTFWQSIDTRIERETILFEIFQKWVFN
jgi:hypothetical protein